MADKKSKVIVTSGKRKRAVARASLVAGTGKVRVNGVPLDSYQPAMSRMRIKESLLLADKIAPTVDIQVSTHGGGQSGQADAARLAIAKALVEFSGSQALKELFLKYDRTMLVADVRRNESAKPNSHGKARAKRQKSYR